MALVKLGKLNEDGALVHERDAGSALKASEVMIATRFWSTPAAGS
ncbi:hypothetical protein X731_04810 [Mesorhizobium sp. L2C054A000]|nr:hypothetical protein X731_04810 [Mesorhizobium sp. L2C054A000]